MLFFGILRFYFSGTHLEQFNKLTAGCGSSNIENSKESVSDSMDICLSPISNSNNNETGFESDNISVTESPKLITDEENDKKSMSPISGAFTSLQTRESEVRKPDLFSSLTPQFHNLANFNPALTAQLFLQNPLLPQPSQWLYNQLYGGYNDLPWFRTITKSCGILEKEPNKPSRLMATNTKDRDNLTTRQTPTPEEIEESTINNIFGPIRNTKPKQVDVWRPY